MRFGVTLPNLGIGGGPAKLIELATAAESAGWDGVFVWDTVWSPDWDALFRADRDRRATWDPWVLLSVMATATDRVRLGTMVTPLSRRRPWKVAAETATIDHLCAGRLILAVSLGWLPDGAFANVNEETDRRVRAERLDEALDIITGLWTGDTVVYDGRHYQIDGLSGARSQQQPRIPIWVVGAWPLARSMARARRFDGLIPAVQSEEHGWVQPSPEQLAPIVESLDNGTALGYEVVVEGNSSRDATKGAAKVRPYAAAGATWWLEGVWSFLYEPATAIERMRARILAGPPA
jgi:alkanesulfonate monooxygenase SsuD/methylene tetrahydromethanopterin reductase-like flavin-dependent oxidoreductase (luciferase family)